MQRVGFPVIHRIEGFLTTAGELGFALVLILDV